MRPALVYVHGLWFTGREAGYLRRRLARKLAADDRVFSYRSVTATIAENAAALRQFLIDLSADPVHLVGHSLGGLVILKLFENPPPLPAGRIVLLGSPLHGSRAAQGFARLPFGRAMLGVGAVRALLEPEAAGWTAARDIGVIAGRSSFGLGSLVARLDGPNDGTVLVEETRLAGATDHVVLPVSHSSMLFSDAVVRQAAGFLERGSFAR